jgi:hypothetical protein
MLYVSIILAAFLLMLGIVNGWIWLYLPVGLFLIVTIAGLDRPVKKGKAPAVSTGPQVRPIVIRKKYVGPPSIYPERMKMFVVPRWDHNSMWEKSAKGLGKLGVLADRLVAKAVGGGKK